MFWAIAGGFLVLWYIALLTGYTMGGIINILLVIAIVMLLVRVIQEKIHCNYLNACWRR